jgi:hypothetical protein
MVECQLPKLDVAGSIPVARSSFLTVGKQTKPDFSGNVQRAGTFQGMSATAAQ